MAIPSHNDLLRVLPYARRYARALSGSQQAGDTLVSEGLKALMAGDGGAAAGEPARLALYRAVTRRFAGGQSAAGAAGLSHAQRKLLLLTALEELPLEEAAQIADLPAEAAAAILAEARERLRASAATDVLIIEDEPIIAMDIESLVQHCGHRVIGVAASESEAVAIAARERPGLILADINLGRGGDGMQAVARIQRHLNTPVIFVTAYPERLLTGEGEEPPFVITKPFEPMTLAIATYQAVTGGLRAI